MWQASLKSFSTQSDKIAYDFISTNSTDPVSYDSYFILI